MLHADLAALVGAMLHERYRVDSLLGSVGMGAVFKGHHTGLGRDVAIKVLHPEFGRDPSVGKRFEREATSASRLDHPNCVRVTDFGTTETGTTYLVMELLSGTELQARLGQPWAPQAMIATAKQMLAGLEHAHHFGIVHRDLKPENVYVTKDYRGEEVVKLVDFGIAKLLDEQGVEKLTRQGVVFGTPRYMSPEQAAGGKIDERTDLYAAGLIFYEMLAGRGPFDTEDTAQLLRMQIMAPPPPLPDSVPVALAKVVEKLLEKSKADRYAHARDVIAALDEAATSLNAAPILVPSASGLGPADASSSGSSGSSESSGLSGLSASGRGRGVGAQAARSGAAWQPAVPPPVASASTAAAFAPAGSSTGGHPTLAYAENYPATATGSHLGVGQMSTGQYESLAAGAAMASSQSWTGSHPSLTAPELSAPGVSRTIPVVTHEPIERRSPPPARRTWVPWAIAGVVVVLALVGVTLVVSGVFGDDPPATDTAKPTPDAAVTPADDTGAAVDGSGASPEQPAPGPQRNTQPTTPTYRKNGSRSSPSAPAEKSTDGAEAQPSGSSEDPTPSKADEVPADTKPSNEATTDPPADATDPPGDAAELSKREPQRAKGNDKGKGKDKDK
jgi:serine/threonine protein kinase